MGHGELRARARRGLQEHRRGRDAFSGVHGRGAEALAQASGARGLPARRGAQHALRRRARETLRHGRCTSAPPDAATTVDEGETMKLFLPHLSRKALLLSVAVCTCVAASCSRGQVAEDKPAETVPVQELVAQADRYYAARDKIENAREAVAVMRRARERLRRLRER